MHMIKVLGAFFEQNLVSIIKKKKVIKKMTVCEAKENDSM